MALLVLAGIGSGFYLAADHVLAPGIENHQKLVNPVKLSEPLEPTRENNTLYIPQSENVHYTYTTDPSQTRGFEVEDNSFTIPEDTTITVYARPVSGYAFEEQKSYAWDYEFDESLKEQIDTPEVPTQQGNVITIPDENTIDYSYRAFPIDSSAVMGEVIERDNELVIPANGMISVTATPTAGHEFEDTETHSWEYYYDPNAVISREESEKSLGVLIGEMITIFTVLLVAASSPFVIRGIMKSNDAPGKEISNNEEPLPIESTEQRIQQWDNLRNRYEKVTKDITMYEMDLKVALDYPVMNDVSDDKTRQMIEASKKANLIHLIINKSGLGGNNEVLEEYHNAVVNLENAFEIAERNAKKIALQGISIQDRRDVKMARNLLTHIENWGNNAKIKENYLMKLNEVIHRINKRQNVVIPGKIMTTLEDATRKEIEPIGDSL